MPFRIRPMRRKSSLTMPQHYIRLTKIRPSKRDETQDVAGIRWRGNGRPRATLRIEFGRGASLDAIALSRFRLSNACLRLRAQGSPSAPRTNVDVEQLCDFTLLRSISGATRMHALMGWQYLEASRKQVAISLSKARWLKRSYDAFTLGVLSVVLNAFFPLQGATSASSASIILKCSVRAQAHIDCTVKPMETAR